MTTEKSGMEDELQMLKHKHSEAVKVHKLVSY